MAKEPYVSSAVYDMTGGLQPAPADDGYNIAMWVNTPCGPITKTKVLSQKDFIDKYMTGTTITPNDHMSAIMAYMTLAQNPLYLVRACPVTYLEGISCTGNSYLFDKSFKPLNSYNRFKLGSVAVSGEYYKVGISDSEYLQESKQQGIDKLVASIMPEYESGTSTAKDMAPISVQNFNISSRMPLWFSDNIALKSSQIRYGEYSHIELENNTYDVLQEGTSLNIGDTTYYYYGTGSQSGTYSNGVAIHYAHNGEFINAHLFLHLVAQKAGCIENVTDGAVLVLKINNDIAQVSLYDSTVEAYPLNIKIYGDTSRLLPHDIGETFTDAADFDNKDITWLYAEPASAVSGASVYLDNETHLLSYYKDGDSEPCLQISTEQGVLLSVDDHNGRPNCYLFLADAPTADGKVKQQVFCLTLNDPSTPTKCNQIRSLCENYDDFVNFFINRWCGIKNDFDVMMDGKVELWTKASAPFASANSILNEAISIDTDATPSYHYTVAGDAENAILLKHSFLWVQVNDVLYYNGTIPDGFIVSASTQVQLTPNACTSAEFKALLENALYLNQQIGKYNGYFVTTNEIAVQCDSQIELDNVENIDQSGIIEQFAIVQKFPTTESMFRYSYELDEDSVDASGSIYNLHLNYKNGEVKENWTISFNPGKTDGYGVDQWYNRVNSDYFQIVSFTEEGVLGEIQDTFTSQAWGRGIGIPEYNVQYAINAMQSIPEYEDGISYHVLSDAGVANTSLANAIEALAEQMHSVYLASLPEAELNINSLIAYVGGADLKSYQTRMLAAGDRININGFSKILPGSYKLLLQYISMFRNKSAEFAPNFGLAHGVVGVSNLVQDFTKPEREKLLDYHIESLKGGVVTEYYINRNDTAQKAKSYMSEDQNVRMTNIAVHLCEDNLKQYIGELNTAVLRDLVQTRLTTAIQDRLFKGKSYAPAMYRVVCDDSNNPLSVIEQNQLVVSLYASFTPSIQYVLVDHFIVPLSQVQ